MKLEFECIICGESARATVSDETDRSEDRPLQTLRHCPNCEIETIWVES